MEFILLTFAPLALLPHLINTAMVGGWGSYRKMWKKLQQTDFESQTLLSRRVWKNNGGQVASQDGDVIWFSKPNDFKIYPWGYVHNTLLIKLDPLAYYWLQKFQDYADENIEHKYID